MAGRGSNDIYTVNQPIVVRGSYGGAGSKPAYLVQIQIEVPKALRKEGNYADKKDSNSMEIWAFV